MENLTGFIVEAKPKKRRAISYQYGAESKKLRPSETFVGYFRQMTDRQGDGTYKKAHVRETLLRDADRRLFSYGEEAVFSIDDVVITIRALRGPASNNRCLSKEFKKYETWNFRQIG